MTCLLDNELSRFLSLNFPFPSIWAKRKRKVIFRCTSDRRRSQSTSTCRPWRARDVELVGPTGLRGEEEANRSFSTLPFDSFDALRRTPLGGYSLCAGRTPAVSSGFAGIALQLHWGQRLAEPVARPFRSLCRALVWRRLQPLLDHCNRSPSLFQQTGRNPA